MTLALQLDHTQVEQMSEGIIWLNHKAEVLGSNPAAAPWLPAFEAGRAHIRRLIAQEIIGHTRFPVAADFLLDATPGSARGAWLSKNRQHEYVLMVLPAGPDPKAAQDLPVANGQLYLALMGDQVRQKLASFQTLLQVTPVPAALRTLTRELDTLLTTMTDLSMLLQRDEVFGSDRIDLEALLSTHLQQLTQQDPRAARHQVEVHGARQGMVYGDAHWLGYAFEVLLAAMVRGMAPKSHLHLSIRQLGDYVVLTVRDQYGAARQPGHMQAQAALAGQSARHNTVELATRMLMARRIIELHSGQLKMTLLSASGLGDHSLASPVESFSVTFLTGLPAHQRSRASCTQCPFTLQAQAYAQDMAQLMADATP